MIPATDVPDDGALPDDLARRLLTFAEQHPNVQGREEAIRRELALTPGRYHQLLNRLIDTRQALEIDPTLTYRLRRIRDNNHATLTRRLGSTIH